MGTGKSPFVRALGCRQEIVKLLAALLSRTPASVLLPSVAAASRRRLSWVLKQTKALLWSEVWAQALEHGLSRWQAAVGLLCVVPAAGGAGAQRCRSHSRARCRAQHLRTRPTPAISDGVSCAASVCGPELRCWGRRFALGTPVWRAESETSVHRILWASETRLSTKEEGKKEKFRFYYPDSIFISLKLLLGLAGDKSLLCLLSCSSSLPGGSDSKASPRLSASYTHLLSSLTECSSSFTGLSLSLERIPLGMGPCLIHV